MRTFTTVCCHWYDRWRKEFVLKRQLLFFFVISTLLVNASFAQSATIDQWRKTFQVWTGGNINGQNSDYMEGQSVPYRAILSNLQPNTSTQIVISFQITKGNDVRHAIDYLTSYNRSVPELSDAMVLDGSGLAGSAAKSTYLLPTAAQPSLAKSVVVSVPFDGAPGATSAPQPYTSASLLPANQKSITIWGGAGAAVTDAHYYYDNGYTGEGGINAADQDAYIIITLNPGNSSTAVLAWGGHIANRTEWGFLPTGIPRSATGISGSPYHMRLEFWANPYKQIGQQDASMQLDFIPPPCNLQATEAGTANIVTNGHSFDCAAPQITVTNINPGFSQTWTVTGPATINGTGGAKTLTTSSPSITLTHTGGCGTIKVSVVISYGLDEANKTCEFTYSVADNIPPTATVASTKALGCNADNPSGQFDAPQIGDNCGTPTLVSGYPQTGTVQENGCMRSLTRTWKYTDACGNTAETSQTLTWIADLAGPTITIAENKELACNTTNAAEHFDTPEVTEGCSAASLVDGYPQTGEVVATNCSRSLTRTWKYRDNCGNETTKTQTLHWTMDTENPTFKASSSSKIGGNDLGCNPGNINGSFAALLLSDFEDNCGLKAIAIKSTSDNTTVGCVHSRTRTWIVTDNCDNSVEVSQTLTWTVDTQAPWLRETSSSKILTIDLGCNPEGVNDRFVSLTAADFDDNCSVKSVNILSTTDGAVVGCVHSRTRTWEISDNCDNKSTVSLTLTWTEDKQKPSASVASTKSLGCNPSAMVFDTPETSDGCSAVSLVDGYPQTSTVSEEGCNRSQMRTWRFKDACGNLSDIISQTLTWTVDKTGPVVEVAENKALGCNPENPSSKFDAPQVSDGCSQATLASGYPQTGDVQVSGCNRSQMRTWRYVDACGNSTTSSQTITWTVDIQAPIFNLNGQAVGSGPATTGYQRVQKLTVEVACDANYSTNPAFEPTDNCGIASASSAPTETTEVTNCATGFKLIVTRKWEATDNCGNKTLLIYEIKVKCCEVLCTYTQGYFGNEGGKACNGTTKAGTAATISAAIGTVPSWSGTKDGFLRIGRSGRSVTILASEADMVIEYLPGGGNSYAFNQTLTGKVSHSGNWSISSSNFRDRYTKATGKGAKAKYNVDNTLLAQTITLGINLGIKANLRELGLNYEVVNGVPKKLITADITGCGSKQVKDCYYNELGQLVTPYHTYEIDGNVVNYLMSVKLKSDNTFEADNGSNKAATVEELFHLASNALYDGTAPAGTSLTSIAGMVDMINNAFDECRMFVGYMSEIPVDECTFAQGAVTSSSSSASNLAREASLTSKLQVQAAPNPYNDKVRFVIESPVSGQGSLEVFNLLGQKLETVYQGYIMAGRGQTVEYTVPLTNRTTLIYLLKVGDQQVTGKLLNRK